MHANLYLERAGGRWVFHASEVPVADLFEYLEDPDHNIDGFQKSFPQVTREQAEYAVSIHRIWQGDFEVDGLDILIACTGVSKHWLTTWRLSLLLTVRWICLALILSAFPLLLTRWSIGVGGTLLGLFGASLLVVWSRRTARNFLADRIIADQGFFSYSVERGLFHYSRSGDKPEPVRNDIFDLLVTVPGLALLGLLVAAISYVVR